MYVLFSLSYNAVLGKLEFLFFISLLKLNGDTNNGLLGS